MKRILLAVAALVAAFLVPAASASAASGWQSSWNQLYARYSAHDNGAVTVSNAEYMDLVQDKPAACGLVDASTGDYVAPAVPASVLADISADKAPRYFHKTTQGAFHWTANGTHGVTYRSNHAGREDTFWDSAGIWTVVNHYSTVYRAWVADFRGAGCDVWTEIQYTS